MTERWLNAPIWQREGEREREENCLLISTNSLHFKRVISMSLSAVVIVPLLQLKLKLKLTLKLELMGPPISTGKPSQVDNIWAYANSERSPLHGSLFGGPRAGAWSAKFKIGQYITLCRTCELYKAQRLVLVLVFVRFRARKPSLFWPTTNGAN